VVWLQQGYQLEFLGKSTFFPGLFLSSLAFFGSNVFILGVIINDVSRQSQTPTPPQHRAQEQKTSSLDTKASRRQGEKSSTSGAKSASKIFSKRSEERGDEQGQRQGDRYRNVLEDYMRDLNTAGVGRREQAQGMVLGEVSDSDSE
jgi:hypothetical protein